MANVDALIQEGMAAIKAGRKEDAKRALMKAVELDEHSEQGWLWLSACVDTTEEQQICLENVLAINPNNEKARKGLAAINQKKGISSPPPPAPATPAKQDIFGDINYGSSPFGDSGGWDNDPFGDPYASPTSVDWNTGESSPAARHSDPHLPTSDELDNWVSGLSLNTAQPESSSPFTSTPSSSPFSGTDSGFDDPFGSASDFDSISDPFGGKAADPFGSNSGPSSSPFSFDMPASDSDDALGFDAVAPASTGSSAFDFGTPSGSSSSPFSDYNFDDVAASPASADPFGSGPFSAPGSFDDVADPFGSSSPFGAQDDPFQSSENAFSFSTPSQSANHPSNDPFDDPFASSAGTFGTSVKDDDLFDPFDGGADDVFANVPGSKPASTGSFGVGGKSSAFGATSVFDEPMRKKTPSGNFAFGGNKLTPAQQSYFKAIPPEIQAGGGGSKADIKLIAMVAGLALLNMISFAMLLLNLTKR